MNLNHFGLRISKAYDRLSKLSNISKASPAGKWNQYEILGHLVDSSINNYRRFILSVTENKLEFDGYKQEQWVKLQKYDEMSWPELIRTWKSMNDLLRNLIIHLDRDQLNTKFAKHNLHEVGYKKFDHESSYTLWEFIEDYLDHIDHHIAQIEALSRFRAD